MDISNKAQSSHLLPQAIIFDLDGTIIDPFEGVCNSVQQAVLQLGYPAIPRRVVKTFIGPPIEDSFRKYYLINEEKAEILADLFRDIYREEKYLMQAKLYEGWREVLNTFQDAGIYLALATFKRKDFAERILINLGIYKYFRAVHGSIEGHKKTKVQIIEQCIHDIGSAERKSIVYTGDTMNDAKSARIAEVAFVGVTYGYGFERGTQLEDAVAMADRPADFIRIFALDNAVEYKRGL